MTIGANNKLEKNSDTDLDEYNPPSNNKVEKDKE